MSEVILNSAIFPPLLQTTPLDGPDFQHWQDSNLLDPTPLAHADTELSSARQRALEEVEAGYLVDVKGQKLDRLAADLRDLQALRENVSVALRPVIESREKRREIRRLESGLVEGKEKAKVTGSKLDLSLSVLGSPQPGIDREYLERKLALLEDRLSTSEASGFIAAFPTADTTARPTSNGPSTLYFPPETAGDEADTEDHILRTLRVLHSLNTETTIETMADQLRELGLSLLAHYCLNQVAYKVRQHELHLRERIAELDPSVDAVLKVARANLGMAALEYDLDRPERIIPIMNHVEQLLGSICLHNCRLSETQRYEDMQRTLFSHQIVYLSKLGLFGEALVAGRRYVDRYLGGTAREVEHPPTAAYMDGTVLIYTASILRKIDSDHSDLLTEHVAQLLQQLSCGTDAAVLLATKERLAAVWALRAEYSIGEPQMAISSALAITDDIVSKPTSRRYHWVIPSSVFLSLARAYLAAGKAKEAVDAALRCFEVSIVDGVPRLGFEEYSARAQLEHARGLMLLSRLTEAETAVRKAIECIGLINPARGLAATPDLAEAYQLLAEVAAQGPDLKAVEAAVETCLELWKRLEGDIPERCLIGVEKAKKLSRVSKGWKGKFRYRLGKV